MWTCSMDTCFRVDSLKSRKSRATLRWNILRIYLNFVSFFSVILRPNYVETKRKTSPGKWNIATKRKNLFRGNLRSLQPLSLLKNQKIRPLEKSYADFTNGKQLFPGIDLIPIILDFKWKLVLFFGNWLLSRPQIVPARWHISSRFSSYTV